MPIYVVVEDCHGIICYAATYKAALTYLVKHNWLTKSSIERWDSDRCVWVLIDEILGENWLDIVLAMTREEFNDFFNDSIYIDEVSLCEEEL